MSWKKSKAAAIRSEFGCKEKKLDTSVRLRYTFTSVKGGNHENR